MSSSESWAPGGPARAYALLSTCCRAELHAWHQVASRRGSSGSRRQGTRSTVTTIGWPMARGKPRVHDDPQVGVVSTQLAKPVRGQRGAGGVGGSECNPRATCWQGACDHTDRTPARRPSDGTYHPRRRESDGPHKPRWVSPSAFPSRGPAGYPY